MVERRVVVVSEPSMVANGAFVLVTFTVSAWDDSVPNAVPLEAIKLPGANADSVLSMIEIVEQHMVLTPSRLPLPALTMATEQRLASATPSVHDVCGMTCGMAMEALEVTVHWLLVSANVSPFELEFDVDASIDTFGVARYVEVATLELDDAKLVSGMLATLSCAFTTLKRLNMKKAAVAIFIAAEQLKFRLFPPAFDDGAMSLPSAWVW